MMVDAIFQHHTATQLLDKRMHRCETESAACPLLARSTVEAVEDAFELLRWQPGPLVPHLDPRMTFGSGGADSYVTAARRVTQRVIEQIAEDQREPASVAAPPRTGAGLDLQIYFTSMCSGPVERHDLGERRVELRRHIDRTTL